MEASQDMADGTQGFVSRYSIGDRVIFSTEEGDIAIGTIQSITFDAAGVFYDIELDDASRTVVHRIGSLDVEPEKS